MLFLLVMQKKTLPMWLCLFFKENPTHVCFITFVLSRKCGVQLLGAEPSASGSRCQMPDRTTYQFHHQLRHTQTTQVGSFLLEEHKTQNICAQSLESTRTRGKNAKKPMWHIELQHFTDWMSYLIIVISFQIEFFFLSVWLQFWFWVVVFLCPNCKGPSQSSETRWSYITFGAAVNKEAGMVRLWLHLCTWPFCHRIFWISRFITTTTFARKNSPQTFYPFLLKNQNCWVSVWSTICTY